MAALWQRSELVSRQRLYASLALTGLQLQGIAIASTTPLIDKGLQGTW